MQPITSGSSGLGKVTLLPLHSLGGPFLDGYFPGKLLVQIATSTLEEKKKMPSVPTWSITYCR